MNKYNSQVFHDCLSYVRTFSITDPCVEEVKTYLATQLPQDTLFVNAKEITEDIRHAIIKNDQLSFYKKHTYPKILVIEVANKLGEATEIEILTVICARRTQQLPTIILSEKPISDYISNETLLMFLRISTSIRNTEEDTI